VSEVKVLQSMLLTNGDYRIIACELEFRWRHETRKQCTEHHFADHTASNSR